MQISILLPYKENYTKNRAGAVSLFVKDITNISEYKDSINVFGSTDDKNYLTKNYININLKKKIFQSSSKEYIKSFLQNKKFNSTQILEIHNRPNYVKQIRSEYKNQIFLYFHNDPLTMNGSKGLLERVFLINNIDKIIFNSKWSKKRFFFGFKDKDKFENKTSVCYQSTNRIKVNFKNKKKLLLSLVN